MAHIAKLEVEKGNPWYTDDQFVAQLRNPAVRVTVEGRWRIYSQFIANWSNGRRGTPIRILDAGCGDGINLYGCSRALVKIEQEFELYGTDYNVLRARRACRIPGVVGVVTGSLLELPFPDEKFDVVFCNHVLEHINEDLAAMRELRRVLKRDGLLIIGVPNEGCLVAQLRNRVFERAIGRTTDHVQFYTARSLTGRLQTAGLQLAELRRENIFMPRLRWSMGLMASARGRRVVAILLRLFPSQAAGLIGAFLKKGDTEFAEKRP